MRGRTRSQRAVVVVAVLLVAALQAMTVWWFDRPRVDESEVVHFAVNMLGGDLDPGWYGYGPINAYLLLGVYWVTYAAQRVLGLTSGVEDFARELFRGGLFFQVGRYVYAVYGVATVALLATAARRSGVALRWVLLYAALALTAADAVEYANYIRTDTLLGLVAAGCVAVAARERVTRSGLIAAGLLAAVAVSVKISGATLGAVPLVLALVGLRRRTVTVRDVALAAVVTVAAVFLVTPFVNPVGVALDAYVLRVAEDPFRYGTEFFAAPTDRLARILGVLRASVGLPMLVLAAAAATCRGAVGRLALATAGVLLLIAGPFMISIDLPTYWFIPVQALTRLLALLGAVGIAARVRQLARARGWRRPPGAVTAVRGVALTALMAVVGMQLVAVGPRWSSRTSKTNIDLAQEWLEENRTASIPIRLNGPYLQSMPDVYDPSETRDAKRISRAFIFDRWQKPFLNRVFIGWLGDEYGPAYGVEPTQFHPLTALRVDLTGELPSAARITLALCPDDGECAPLDGRPTEGEASGEPGAYVPSDASRLVLADLILPSDGSADVRIAVEGASERVYLYYGLDGSFDEGAKSVLPNGHPAQLPLWFPVQQDRVEELDLTKAAADTDDINELVTTTTWVVSGPAIYGRFIDIDLSTVPPTLADEARRLRTLYRDLTEQPPVEIFSRGTGPGIVIYEVTPQ